MKNWKFFNSDNNIYKQLIANNQKGVEDYNGGVLSPLLLIAWILMMIPIAAEPFSARKTALLPVYYTTFSLFFALFLLFRVKKFKKYALLGLYASFSILLSLSIYLSVVHTPYMRATFMLVGLSLMPVSFIDRPRRMNLFLAFWVVAHTVLAMFLKPDLALDDTVNLVIAGVLGGYLGHSITLARLESIDGKRLLVKERDTDALTGLLNRRKLYEALGNFTTEGSEKPTGVFMIDIDHFKAFNDRYGHTVGDKCLGDFGVLMKSFKQKHHLEIYRYGGEEFVVFVFGYNTEEMVSIAESMRLKTREAKIAGQDMTISIGIAPCGDDLVKNYERVIAKADEALYVAKNAGRDRVEINGAMANLRDPQP